MARRRQRGKGWRRRILPVAFLAAVAGCVGSLIFSGRVDPLVEVPDGVLVTGYCNCGTCCSWERSWFGLGPAVHSAGPNKGRRKRVGVTASGTTAHRGTVAADPSVYPFGTRLNIPGYGIGVVEDVGGAIRGRHIDVWFPTHAAARAWGVHHLDVTVLPGKAKSRK